MEGDSVPGPPEDDGGGWAATGRRQDQSLQVGDGAAPVSSGRRRGRASLYR